VSLWGKIFGINRNPEYELGIKLYNEGKYELAVAQLERAIPKAGKNDPLYALGMFYAAESHAHIGTAKFLGGHLEEALDHFRKAVAENPTYPDIFYRMGVIQHRLGNSSESIVSLRKALELNPNYFEATCYLGIVYYESGMRDEADPVFAKALKIGSESPSPISKFLSDHLAGRETDIPPLSSLKQLMRSDADFDSALLEGIEAYNTGNFEDAARSFALASEIHPDYADVRFKLGLARLRAGEHTNARRDLEAAISINPRYAEAYFYLGITYLDERRYREATAQFERADILYFIGDCYLRMDQLADAERFFRHSLQINPHFLRAKEKLAHILIRNGDYEAAEKMLDPPEADFADLFKILGDIKFYRGELKAAEEFYRKSLAVNSEYSEANLSLALTLRNEGREAEAEEILRKLIDHDPENVLARSLLGHGSIGSESR
jgi:tetratricopeptide (TPR) repeat protein